MTNDKREFYDKQYMWARLSMSQDEYEDWYHKVSWPCCAEKPDGIFDSTKECREYFYYE
jgi:hypothetical protein